MAQDRFQTTPDPKKGHGRTKNLKSLQSERVCGAKGAPKPKSITETEDNALSAELTEDIAAAKMPTNNSPFTPTGASVSMKIGKAKSVCFLPNAFSGMSIAIGVCW